MIKEEVANIPGACVLYFDGSYKRSLHQAIGGFVIIDARGKLIQKEGMQLEVGSNNEAEYTALFEGLQAAHNLKMSKVIKGDSLPIHQGPLSYSKRTNRTSYPY